MLFLLFLLDLKHTDFKGALRFLPYFPPISWVYWLTYVWVSLLCSEILMGQLTLSLRLFVYFSGSGSSVVSAAWPLGPSLRTRFNGLLGVLVLQRGCWASPSPQARAILKLSTMTRVGALSSFSHTPGGSLVWPIPWKMMGVFRTGTPSSGPLILTGASCPYAPAGVESQPTRPAFYPTASRPVLQHLAIVCSIFYRPIELTF